MCEFSEKYHISPTYGYTEILDSNFNEVSKGFSESLLGLHSGIMQLHLLGI